MNVFPTLHVKTVLLVPTQTAHTVATAQVDGQTQTVQMVNKQSLYSRYTENIYRSYQSSF